MFTGDQERLIRLALKALMQRDMAEVDELRLEVKDLKAREEELKTRLSEVDSILSLPFGQE